MKNRRSDGVTIFAILIIASSVLQMLALLEDLMTGLSRTRSFFQYLPEHVIVMRHLFSWALRVAGIVAAVGILRLNDLCRKLAIALFIFTILTVGWKHPVEGFRRHAAQLDARLYATIKEPGIRALKATGMQLPLFESLAPVSAMMARAFDVLFALGLIYFFTRKKVRGQFDAPSAAGPYGLLENYLAAQRAGMADRLIPDASRGGRILDIGCGSTPVFLRTVTFEDKYGVDVAISKVSPEEKITLQQINLEKDIRLAFEDDYFDVVTMLAVFEHIAPDKLCGVLKEVKRVLKPEGRFILTTPCPWGGKVLWLMAGIGLINSMRVEEHKATYAKAAVLEYIEKAGFHKDKTRFGYFELFLNSWAYADK